MMFRILLLSLATLVMSQPSQPPQNNWFWNLFQQNLVDTLHGYAVQYDDNHDLVIFVDSNSCYLVSASSDLYWDGIINDKEDLYYFTEHIYHQIVNNEGLTHLSHREAVEAYESRLEQWECEDKPVSQVSYRPS